MAIKRGTETIVATGAVSVLVASLLAIAVFFLLPHAPPTAPDVAEAPPRLTEPTMPGTKQMYDAYVSVMWRRDHGQAEALLKPGADAGQSDAQYWLGEVYMAQREYDKGVEMLRRSAEKSNPYALEALGDAYSHGDGVGHDLATAIRYWRAAAQAGVAESQASMGIAYEQGWAANRSLVMAYVWYSVAAHNTNPSTAENAASLRDRLRKQMTDQEYVEAQHRLADWHVQ